MSGNEIRTYLNCVILENVDDRSLKIKRLLYTYTIGLLGIPARYKDSVKVACEGDEFYISGYKTVWQEARNLSRYEKQCEDHDDEFDTDTYGGGLFAAIVDTVDELRTLIIDFMMETFETDIESKPIPEYDTMLLVDAVYAVYTGRTKH
jgi:hypothetical protein